MSKAEIVRWKCIWCEQVVIEGLPDPTLRPCKTPDGRHSFKCIKEEGSSG